MQPTGSIPRPTALVGKALRVILSCNRPVQLEACRRYLEQVDRTLGRKTQELWMLYYRTARRVQRGEEELPW